MHATPMTDAKDLGDLLHDAISTLRDRLADAQTAQGLALALLEEETARSNAWRELYYAEVARANALAARIDVFERPSEPMCRAIATEHG